MTDVVNTVRRESNGEATRSRSSPSITACLRCREQKLKCGRERPICARCDRLNATCYYPSPPNRRGPRTQRNSLRLLHRTTERGRDASRPRHAVLQHPAMGPVLEQPSTNNTQRPNVTSRHSIVSLSRNESLADILPGNDAEADNISVPLATGTPVLSESYSTQLRVTSSFTTEPAPTSDQPPLPPTALGLSLLEIYFSRVYNASLMFYKPVLFQQYLAGELHGALLKALFALATLFLQPTNIDDERHVAGMHSELKVLSAYHSCGFPWAKAALREALMLAVEVPSLMVTQALECLQHFWFGVGQPHSGNLCLALAYRSCQLLGYSKKIAGSTGGSDLSLESELGRRCFWACWTSTCIVMEPESFVRSCWQEVAGVPLPGLISNTSSGHKILLTEKMDENWHSSVLGFVANTETHPGVAAQLVKMVGIWAKVQFLCKDYASSSITRSFDSARELSHLAESLFDNANSLRSPVHQDGSSSEGQVLFLVHDAIYHQCQITIHSMIVPLFSGIPPDPKIGLGMQKKSAETVARHAELFYTLLEPYICGRYHASRLPPLVGYGAFVAGIVLLATEISCQERETSGSSAQTVKENYRLAAVKSILRLLDNIRVYWTVLQRPWETLDAALQTELSKRKAQPRPTNSRGSQLSVQVDDYEPPEISETYNQNMDISNEQLQILVADSSGGGGGHETQVGSHPSTVIDDRVEAQSEMEESGSLMDQINLPQDYNWYSLSFAEAGVEQFAGLDPSTLFLQGWRTFG